MESVDRDVVIVGAGIVGLATAYRLSEARPNLRVDVLESEAVVAAHQSSRNSGVVHAGLYYAPGSAKARWCVQGKAALEEFCAAHGVPYEHTGKVVVAVKESELPSLERLADRARQNGVTIRPLDRDGVRALEPEVNAVAGLHSPETAVTDFGAVAHKLSDVVRGSGVRIRTSTRVMDIDSRADLVRVTTDQGDLTARLVVTCGGLQADRLAALTDTPMTERILPFRGSWLVLRRDLSSMIGGNVYPVPGGNGLPFLGVHLTRRINGDIWIGPNAVLAGARNGRNRWSLNRRDLMAALGYAGFWRLASRHLATGVAEVWRDLNVGAAIRAVRQYVPEITKSDVSRGPWGVRAQLLSREGLLVDDFTLRPSGRVLHLLNAPSPAATASLAIGAELRDHVLARL